MRLFVVAAAAAIGLAAVRPFVVAAVAVIGPAAVRLFVVAAVAAGLGVPRRPVAAADVAFVFSTVLLAAPVAVEEPADEQAQLVAV